MRRPFVPVLRALVGAVALLGAVAACAGIITGPDDGPDLRPRSMTVSPSQLLLGIGDTARLTAALFDVTGAPASLEAGVTLRFVSLDTSIARVDGTGLITGVGGGTVTVRAEYGALGLGIQVQVLARPRIEIVSGNGQTAEQGDTLALPLVVRARNAFGALMADTALVFGVRTGGGQLTATTVRTDVNGEASVRWVLGLPLGEQSVRVTQSGFDSTTFTATAVAGTKVRRVSIAATRLTLDFPGDTARYTALAYNIDNVVLSGATFAWSSSDTTVATVSATGLVTARAPGQSVIGVTSNGARDSVTVTVAAPPVIAVSPSTVNVTATLGGQTTATIPVEVTNAGGGRLTGLARTIGITNGTGWLSATFDSTTAPTRLTISTDGAALAAGTYTGAVTVASSMPGVASVQIPVTLTVVGSVGPIGIVDIGDSFTHPMGLQQVLTGTLSVPAPTARTVTVRSGDANLILLSADSTTVGTAEVTIPIAAGATQFRVFVQGIEGESRIYRTTYLTAEASDYGRDSIPLYTRRPASRLVAPNGLTAGAVGGEDPVIVVEVGLENTSVEGLVFPMQVRPGAAAPSFRVVADSLRLASVRHVASGATIGADQGPDSAVVFALAPLRTRTAIGTGAETPASVRLARTGTPGVARVHLVSPAEYTNASPMLLFTLTAPTVPVITATPDSIAFTAVIGARPPAAQLVEITNSGTGSLSGVQRQVTYDVAGQTWLTSAASGSTAPLFVTLGIDSASVAGLAVGTYRARVTMSSTLAGVATKQVVVTLNVIDTRPVPVLSVSDFVPLGEGLTRDIRIGVSETYGARPVITLTSLDSTALRFSIGIEGTPVPVISRTLSTGGTGVSFFLHALGGATGRTVRAVASSPGIVPETLEVRIGAPRFELLRAGDIDVPATGGADPIPYLRVGTDSAGVFLESPVSSAGPAPRFVVRTTTPSLGLVRFIATSRTFGESQGPADSVVFQLRPGASRTREVDQINLEASLFYVRSGFGGTATVVATGPSAYATVSSAITYNITGPTLPKIVLPTAVGVGAGLMYRIDLALPSAATSTVAVTLRTLDSTAVRLSEGTELPSGPTASRAIPGGDDVAPFWLHAVEGTAGRSVRVIAEAAGYAPDTMLVEVVTPAMRLERTGPFDILGAGGEEPGLTLRVGAVYGDGFTAMPVRTDGPAQRFTVTSTTPSLGLVRFAASSITNGADQGPADSVTFELRPGVSQTTAVEAVNFPISLRFVRSGLGGVAIIRASGSSEYAGATSGAAFSITAVARRDSVTRIALAAARTDLVAGDTARILATTYNAADSLITTRPVTWTSSSTATATVDGSGLVTAVAAGTTYIVAAVDAGRDSLLITVAPRLTAGLTKVSGDSLSATVATPLAEPWVVQYADSTGAAVAGATIRFYVLRGCCNPHIDTTVTTDAQGFARLTPTMPYGADVITGTVTVVGRSVPAVTFTATPVAGPAVSLLVRFSSNGGFAGQPIGATTVWAQDQYANIATSFSGPVTMTLSNGPTEITTLGGTTTRNAVAGVAVFDDLTINVANTSWVLIATSPGLSSSVSAAFSVTIPFTFGLVNTPLIPLNGTATVRAVSGVPAYGAGFAMTIVPSGGGILSVNAPADVIIPAGDSVATWTVTGLQNGWTFLNLIRDGGAAGQIVVTVSSNTISVPLQLNAPYTRVTSLPINLPAPAPAGGTTLAIVSSDTTVVRVLTPTVTIAEGTRTGNAQLEGLRLGQTAVTATGAALATGVSTVRVTAALDVIESNASLNANFSTATVTTRLLSGGAVFPAPAGGIPITWVSRAPACVATPAPTSVAVGLNSVATTVAYGGVATPTCSTYLVATSPDFDPDSVLVRVDPQPTSTFNLTPRIAAGLSRQGSLSLGAASPAGGTLVTLTSSDSTRLLLSADAATVGSGSIQLVIPPGSFSTSYWYAGVEGAHGTQATISATVARYVSPAARAVDIDTLGVEFSGSTSLTTLGGDGAGTVLLGSINTSGGNQTVINETIVRAGGLTYSVTVTSATPTVAQPVVGGVAAASRTLTIGPGQSRASLGVRPLTTGTTSFNAAAPGVVTPVRTGYPATITVTQPTTSHNITQRLAAGLTRQGSVSLGAASPPGGTVITLTSSDSTRLVLSSDAATVGRGTLDVTIPAGSFSGSYWYAALEGRQGTDATISGTVVGGLFADLPSRTVTIDTLGVEYSGSTTLTTLGGNGSGTVLLGSINTTGTSQTVINETVVRAGGPTYTITITSADPAVAMPLVAGVADVSRTVTIAPGQSRASLNVRPVGTGTTTLNATAPGVVTPVRPGYPATLTVTQPTSSLNLTPRIAAGLTRQGSLSLGAAAPTGGVVVVVRSSDPTRLVVSPDAATVGTDSIDITIPAGSFSTSFWYAGIEGQGGTTATLSIAIPSGLYAEPAARDVAIDTLGVEASGSTTLTTLGGDGAGTVLLGSVNTTGGNQTVINETIVRAGGQTYTVSVTSTTPTVALPVVGGVAASPSTLTIGPGQSRASYAIRPLVAGTTTITAGGAGLVTPVRPGYPATITVSSPGQTLNVASRIGAGLAVQGSLSLGVAAPVGGALVTLTSSDSARILLAPNFTTAGTRQITVPIAQGGFSASFVVMALEDQSGNPTVTAQTPGFTDATTTVAVDPIGVQWSGTSSLTTLSADGGGTVTIGVMSGVAGNRTVSPEQVIRFGGVTRTITMTSSDAGVVLPVVGGVAQQGITATIAPGQSRATVNVRPVAPGTATIAPSSPGILSAETATVPQAVTVTVPTQSLSIGTINIGAGLTQGATISFQVGIPAGGRTLTLTSSDPTKLLLAPDATTAGAAQITFDLTAGTFSRGFQVMGLEGVTGSVGVTASIGGYRDTTFTLSVVQPGVTLDGPPATRNVSQGDIDFRASVGAPSGAGVIAQAVRYGAPGALTVTLTASAPGIGTIVINGVAGSPQSIEIPVGQSQTSNLVAARANFRPLSAGNTTITATIPGFAQQGNAIRTVTVSP